MEIFGIHKCLGLCKMSNPFLCSPKQLGQHWRSVRAQLTAEKTDLEHLNIVTDFWRHAPISAPFLDWDHPNTWPDPWELMSEMSFDPSAIALGMEYTLLLAEDQRWNSNRLELDLSCFVDGSQQLIVLSVDNTYFLNIEYGKVTMAINAAKELVIQQRYHYINKTHKFKD